MSSNQAVFVATCAQNHVCHARRGQDLNVQQQSHICLIKPCPLCRHTTPCFLILLQYPSALLHKVCGRQIFVKYPTMTAMWHKYHPQHDCIVHKYYLAEVLTALPTDTNLLTLQSLQLSPLTAISGLICISYHWALEGSTTNMWHRLTHMSVPLAKGKTHLRN